MARRARRGRGRACARGVPGVQARGRAQSGESRAIRRGLAGIERADGRGGLSRVGARQRALARLHRDRRRTGRRELEWRGGRGSGGGTATPGRAPGWGGGGGGVWGPPPYLFLNSPN